MLLVNDGCVMGLSIGRIAPFQDLWLRGALKRPVEHLGESSR